MSRAAAMNVATLAAQQAQIAVFPC